MIKRELSAILSVIAALTYGFFVGGFAGAALCLVLLTYDGFRRYVRAATEARQIQIDKAFDDRLRLVEKALRTNPQMQNRIF